MLGGQNNFDLNYFNFQRHIFSTLIIAEILLLFFSSINSVSGNPTIISASTNNLCSYLEDGFRFTYALNQYVQSFDSKSFYFHNIISRQHFLRFKIPSSEPVVTLESRIPVPNFSSYNFDIGFSLWSNPFKEKTSKLCFSQFLTSQLTCFNLNHLNKDDLGHMIQSQPRVENFAFKLPSQFYPSIAIQDVRFTEQDNTRYAIIFVEQTLKKRDLTSEITSIDDRNSISTHHFERHFQSYSFENLEKIVNLTESLIIPEYMIKIPSKYEITGIFNWKTNNGKNHEYIILVFNGTAHLYCMNSDCEFSEAYKPFLTECQAKSNKNSSFPLRLIDHHAKLDQLYEIKNAESYLSENVSQRKKHFSIYLLSAMMFLLVCLALLMLSACYYSIKETFLQEQQVKKNVQKINSHASF